MASTMDEKDLPLFNKLNDTRNSNFLELYYSNLKVFLSVAYAVILVLSFFGNLITCFVIWRNRSMHSATNFYLFNLSISQFLFLICRLPLEVNRLWKYFSYPLGKGLTITVGFLSEMFANASVLTITAIAVERYIVICHPLMTDMCNSSRILKSIIAIWICAMCFAMPQVMQFVTVSYEKKELMVSVDTVKSHVGQRVFVIFSLILFLVAMSLITVLYSSILVKLNTYPALHPVDKSLVRSGEKSKSTPRFKRGASQRRLFKMLVTVALFSFLCWAPLHVQRLIPIFGKMEQPDDISYKVYVILTPLSDVLYFLSTAINPLIYNIMSKVFRNAFKKTITSWCRRRDRYRFERTYSEMLASQKEQAEAAKQHTRHSRLQRRLLTTTSSQLCDAPPRPQTLNLSNITRVVNDESNPWRWTHQLAGGSNSFQSPQSISNSSLCETVQEKSKEELVTYLYQVNSQIKGGNRDTTAEDEIETRL